MTQQPLFPGPEHKLLTLGHSTIPLEALLQALQTLGVQAVFDVRSTPYSKFSPQFNRQALASAINGIGLDYYWAGRYLGGRGDLTTLDPVFIAKMERVVTFDKKAVILCSEKDPAKCHRAFKLSAWIHRNTGLTLGHVLDTTSMQIQDSRAFEAKKKESWLWHEFRVDKG